MLLTGHKSRAIFDRHNIINEQELLDAGDQLVAYLAQQAQAPRGRSHAEAVGRPAHRAAPPPPATRHRVRGAGGGWTPPVCAPRVAPRPHDGSVRDRSTRGDDIGGAGRLTGRQRCVQGLAAGYSWRTHASNRAHMRSSPSLESASTSAPWTTRICASRLAGTSLAWVRVAAAAKAA